jgi:hypothetical protein
LLEVGSDAAAITGALPIGGALAAIEQGSDTAIVTASDAAAIWSYILPNGMVAADCAASMRHMLDELHQVRALNDEHDLTVSNALRAVGSILQAITPTSITRQ